MAGNRNVRQQNVAHDLFNAAVNGDLKQLLFMLDAGINVNSTAVIKLKNYSTSWDMTVTALSAAAAHGKTEIVSELLKRGASIFPVSQNNFDFPNWSTHALICYSMCNIHNDENFQILHMLLRDTQELLPDFHSGYGMRGMIQVAVQVNNRMLPFMWLEAIARNDLISINKFIKEGISPPTLDDFKIFLFNRQITVQLATNISNALNYMVCKKVFANETALTFTKLAEANITFLLELDSFPMEMKEYLDARAKINKGRSLLELYAEFRSLFCFDELLPRVPVDSAAFKCMDQIAYLDPELTKEKNIERIRALQNPDTLPDLLNLDQVNIMIRLGACKEETGDNPAALILAEILLFKHKEIQNFSEELMKKCLRILTKLYSLTDFEKILLQSHKSQNEKLNELQGQNSVLAEKLHEVQQSLVSLTTQNEKILSILLANNTPQNDAKTTESAKRSIFK